MEDADILALLNDCGRQRDAFDMIVARYQQKILRLTFAILGERTSAEDAAQDALLRIWRSLDKFRGESSLSTWIYSIARNAALSARKAVRESLPLAEPEFAMTAPSHATPDLMRMVEGLPEPQRRVVILFYLEGKSYVETAALLDLPMGTVKTYLYRARKELALAVAASSASRKMNV
jgi:RNA polymerase sigma-70 factor (ECF subfamily)